MTFNVTAFGLIAQIVASNTFPQGFPVTEFADDADPLDSPDLQIADTGMGLNGDLVVWSRPAGMEVILSVIPGSPSDINLGVLHEANRVAKGKTVARDVVGIILNYPEGAIASMQEGLMITGPVTSSVSSQGRKKTKQYRFMFQNISKSGDA